MGPKFVGGIAQPFLNRFKWSGAQNLQKIRSYSLDTKETRKSREIPMHITKCWQCQWLDSESAGSDTPTMEINGCCGIVGFLLVGDWEGMWLIDPVLQGIRLIGRLVQHMFQSTIWISWWFDGHGAVCWLQYFTELEGASKRKSGRMTTWKCWAGRMPVQWTTLTRTAHAARAMTNKSSQGSLWSDAHGEPYGQSPPARSDDL